MTQVAYKGNVAAREPATSRKALGLWAAMALVIGNMNSFCAQR